MKDRFFLLNLLIVCLILTGCAGKISLRETDPEILRLEKAIEEQPNDFQKRLELSHTYFKKFFTSGGKNYINKAIEEARVSVNLNPESAQAHHFLSVTLMTKGAEDLDDGLIREARLENTKALSITPELVDEELYIPPQYFAGAIYLKKSDNDKKFLDDAIREFKEVIRLKPNLGTAHSALGMIFYEQEKNEMALLELKEASRLMPDNPEFHKLLGELFHKKIHSGKENWDDEAIEQGIKEFKEVIRLTPEDDEAHMYLSIFYLHKGLYDLQLFEAKEAVRLKGNPKNYSTLGGAYKVIGNYDQALKEYNEVLRLKPNLASPHCDIAFTYYLQNRFQEAVQEFKKYFKLADTPDVYSILWQYISLKRLGSEVEAQKLIEDYAHSFKGNEWNSNLLDYYMGRLTESELIAKAKNKGDRCEAFYYIGCQYMLKNEFGHAKEFFQRSLDTQTFCYREYNAARVSLENLQ